MSKKQTTLLTCLGLSCNESRYSPKAYRHHYYMVDRGYGRGIHSSCMHDVCSCLQRLDWCSRRHCRGGGCTCVASLQTECGRCVNMSIYGCC
ncbi:hypothetical protein EJ05DRAFT_144633 [Pseudovirgaria hyperparasitica]|uniref:Uncharacterized protein n=1 Tax=Pseudovirgaria hyperparasitica TaxID=470096 RepID=A0A6A6VWC4_9PEZI|nr:uncharacterized protein EJ05DRAFT_144633 [Pseudovirgaria hyperparasitica]KAF2754543.1 hypothetical protein EJ05DRAFT_144633 [Pseudovirgaria hyperparasitica]